MSKRKPPSQRSERKLDETAKQIARVRERVEKTAETKSPEVSQPMLNSRGKRTFTRQISGPAPTPSTKRPKKV